MGKSHIWMDVDTGVDDAVALLCATKEDSIILEGASAVAGNQTLDKTFKNTRDVLSLGDRADVKVFAGGGNGYVGDPRDPVHFRVIRNRSNTYFSEKFFDRGIIRFTRLGQTGFLLI